MNLSQLQQQIMSKAVKSLDKFGVTIWEHNEYVLTYDGKPISQTYTEREAELIKNFLTKCSEFHKIYTDQLNQAMRKVAEETVKENAEFIRDIARGYAIREDEAWKSLNYAADQLEEESRSRLNQDSEGILVCKDEDTEFDYRDT